MQAQKVHGDVPSNDVFSEQKEGPRFIPFFPFLIS
jgi:hypothetical protein